MRRRGCGNDNNSDTEVLGSSSRSNNKKGFRLSTAALVVGAAVALTLAAVPCSASSSSDCAQGPTTGLEVESHSRSSHHEQKQQLLDFLKYYPVTK